MLTCGVMSTGGELCLGVTPECITMDSKVCWEERKRGNNSALLEVLVMIACSLISSASVNNTLKPKRNIGCTFTGIVPLG